MTILSRYPSPIGFAVAAAGLLLPFARWRVVEPHSDTTIDWSGWTLVFGGRPSVNARWDMWDSAAARSTRQEAPIEYLRQIAGGDVLRAGSYIAFMLAALALIGGVGALILATPRSRALFGTTTALVAVAALGIGEWQAVHGLNGFLAEVDTRPGYGFWIVDGLVALLALLNAAMIVPSRIEQVRPLEAT